MKLYSTRTRAYEKSFKKLYKSGVLDLNKLNQVIDTISSGKKLASKYKDHKPHGELKDCRECHISPDILLIYQVRKQELILVLINIGSHSELFS